MNNDNDLSNDEIHFLKSLYKSPDGITMKNGTLTNQMSDIVDSLNSIINHQP